MMKPLALRELALSDVRLTRELLRQGYDDRAIARAVRAGQLHRIRRGAYVDSDLWADLDERDRHRLMARAVVKARPQEYVVSHYTSLAEHGVDLWGVDLDLVQVSHDSSRPRRTEAGVVPHRGVLRDCDVVMLNGLRVTSAARAVLETVCTHPVETGLVVTNSALNKRIVTTESLRDFDERIQHWPGALRNQVVKRMADGRMQSVAESRVDHLFHLQGLPRPEPQVEVRDEWGHLVGIVDFVWKKFKLFLEFDGKVKYLKFRRPGETLDQFLLREKQREEKICQLTGWVCIRIGWTDLENPSRLASRIRALMASRNPAAS